MKITEFAISHRTAVFVLVICIFVSGALSYMALPREAAPDVQLSTVIVQTPYIGVSPADIETLVTKPLEKEFKGIRGIKTMTSTSAESVSLITLEFESNVEIDDAMQKVRERTDTAQADLPPDVEKTQIMEVSASDWPVLTANISANLDAERLKLIGESIQDEIERIPGVLRVDMTGLVEREIAVLVEPMKLRQYGVSVDEVIRILQAENINLPGGSIKTGEMKYLLRVPGEFTGVEAIANLAIKAPEGQPIRIKDVAKVRNQFKEQDTLSRLTTFRKQADGTLAPITQRNISLSVVKRSGENIVDIANASREVILEFKERLNTGVEVAILNDQSEDISASVKDLENNIISGMLLVLLVLFFFMGGARNATMVALSIPLSMLLTFLVLDLIGFTLNMVVLFSLILALGMIVDNGIVIVENIYRHAGEGKSLPQAALDGTGEVGWAVIASTATTVGAFIPMAFWPGMMGEFMKYLPITVIITLLSSLLVALVINPAIAAVFLRGEPRAEDDDEFAVPDTIVYRTYKSVLGWSLDHKAAVMALCLAAFGVSGGIFVASDLGVEFFPVGTPEQFTVNIEKADGSTLESTDDIIKYVVDPFDGKLDEGYQFTPEEIAQIEAKLRPGIPLIQAWIENVGTGGGQGQAAGGQAPHFGQVSVDLTPAEKQESSPDALMSALRLVYERVPGATILIQKPSSGPSSGKPVNIEVVGENLTVMSQIAQQIKNRIRDVPGLVDLDDNLELTRPEVLIHVDRDRALLSGLDTRSVASTIRTAINGSKATTFRKDDNEYDITVRLPLSMRQNVDDLNLLTVATPAGEQVPLTEVATIKVQGGTGSVRRKDQERFVTISANAAPDALPANVLAAAQERLKDYKPPAGYTIRYTGENDDQMAAASFLIKALMIAAFLMILILVTQFNSISQPIIIMTSILLSIIGVLWSLIAFQQPFGVIMTGIGVISLAGVVVNNSIVMIDFTNQLRERGMDRRESLIISGLVRFRPVMLTASTTILGLLPLAIGVSIDFMNLGIVIGGRSVEMWGPMARAISFGLSVATVLTLVVVPVMVGIDDSLGDFFSNLFKKGDHGPHDPQGPSSDADLTSPEPPEDGSLGTKNPHAVMTIILMVLGMLIAPSAWAKAPEDATAAGPFQAQVEQDPSPDQGPLFRTPEASVPSLDDAILATPGIEPSFETTRTLDLEQLKNELRTQNFDVRVAMSRIAEADATISRAWSALWPTIGTQFQTTIFHEELTTNLGPPGGGGTEIVVRPQVDYNFSAQASLRLSARAWPLLKQAYAARDLSALQIAAVKEELEFSLTQTYFNALLARRVTAIALERWRADLRAVEVLRRKEEAGVAKGVEFSRASVQVSQALQEIEQARLSYEQLLLSLSNLTQTRADFEIAEPKKTTAPSSPVIVKESARTRRETLKLDRAAVDLADLALNEIYWQYLPEAQLTAQAFRPKGTALSPGIWQYSLGVTFEWIIWDGGLREAAIDEREAQLITSKIERQQGVAELDHSIDLAWSEYLAARSQVAISSAQVQNAQTSLDEITQAYELGASPQLDLLEAQDQLQLAKISLAQDEITVQLATERLRFLGGL